MILQRIAEAVTSREWSTVLVELMILVLGIFLGLQVDDWNEARKDRADERQSVQRLHEDVVLADAVTQRVRDRMLGRLEQVKAAADLLANDSPSEAVTPEICSAISATSLTNINAPRLAAFDELVGTGRLDIISNDDLLRSLITLEQYRSVLAGLVSTTSSDNALLFLPAAFPELMQTHTYLEADTEEIRIGARCDLDAMRADPAFLNQFALNADTYDVFIRDGLDPWSRQFQRVHDILDDALGIDHE